MRTTTAFIIGIVIFASIGFVTSSILAAKKSPRTIVAYAEYPLATDQWYVNDKLDGAGKVVAIGRGMCTSKPYGEDWKISLVRADGTKAEAFVRTTVSLEHAFPFVGLDITAPAGYNAGLHVEELSSSTQHQGEFSCK